MGLGILCIFFLKSTRLSRRSWYCRGQIPLGAGMAFGDQYFKRDNVTLAIWRWRCPSRIASRNLEFGNIMALSSFCQVGNNGYAMGTSVARTAVIRDEIGLGYECLANLLTEWILLLQLKRWTKQSTLELVKGLLFWKWNLSISRLFHVDGQYYRTKEEVEEYCNRPHN